MYDILIKNGTVVDGTGKPPFQADVGVRGGKIVLVGKSDGANAARVVNAAGKIVAPGFIDSHNHSDLFMLLGTSGSNELEQGFTTEVLGPCGESAAPFYDGTFSSYRRFISAAAYESLKAPLESPAAYMRAAQARSFGTNFGLLVGHLSVRGHVMGSKNAAPTAEEMDAMRSLVREAMECGYLGFSTGLVYPPSVYASEQELTELAHIAASYGGIYSSHIRGEDNRVLRAVEEAIRTARNAGADLVVSHHKVAGIQNEGLSVQTLRMIDEANASGMKVRMDQYPYLAGACGLIDAVPPQFRTEGTEVLLARLHDAAFRREVRHIIEDNLGEFENFIYKSSFDGCLLLLATDESLVGRSVGEIARERGCDPYDAFFDILIETHSNAMCAYFMINESDMRRIFLHPYTMAGTDFMHLLRPVEREQRGGWHPRSVASAVKRLCMVRDEKLMPLEQEIHRMTGMPADFYHLTGRGILASGMAGDVVVFDYDRLKDNADYTHPYRKNSGIELVLVNGTAAVENGEYTGARAGRVLRRGFAE